MFAVKTVVKVDGEKVSTVERGNSTVVLKALHSARVLGGNVLVVVKDPTGRITRHAFKNGKKVVKA